MHACIHTNIHAHAGPHPQTLRQNVKALEAEREALEAEANAKLAERGKELEEFRARAGDLSAKLEVTYIEHHLPQDHRSLVRTAVVR